MGNETNSNGVQTKTKTFSYIVGSKEEMAFKELKNGQENYNNSNYEEATQHLMKSLLFNYDNFVHEALSNSFGKYFITCLKKNNIKEISLLFHIIKNDKKIREKVAFELKNEYFTNHNTGNFKEALKFLLQSNLLKPEKEIKENIEDLCYENFCRNFKNFIMFLDNNEIEELLNFLNKKKIF